MMREAETIEDHDIKPHVSARERRVGGEKLFCRPLDSPALGRAHRGKGFGFAQPRLDLNKDDQTALACDDVDLTDVGLIAAGEDAIAAQAQKHGGSPFRKPATQIAADHWGSLSRSASASAYSCRFGRPRRSAARATASLRLISPRSERNSATASSS